VGRGVQGGAAATGGGYCARHITITATTARAARVGGVGCTR